MSSTPVRINKRSLPCYRKRLLVGCLMPGGMVFEKLTVEQVMEFTHVSRATAYRWVSGQSAVPKPHWELLQIKALGLMPDPEYRDYRISNGSLITRNGASFPLNALDHFNMVYQQNRELLRLLNEPRLEKTIDSEEIAYLQSLA